MSVMSGVKLRGLKPQKIKNIVFYCHPGLGMVQRNVGAGVIFRIFLAFSKSFGGLAQDGASDAAWSEAVSVGALAEFVVCL